MSTREHLAATVFNVLNWIGVGLTYLGVAVSIALTAREGWRERHRKPPPE